MFEFMSRVSFRMQENSLYGNAQRTDRSSPEILLNKRLKALGRTKYGTFEVQPTS